MAKKILCLKCIPRYPVVGTNSFFSFNCEHTRVEDTITFFKINIFLSISLSSYLIGFMVHKIRFYKQINQASLLKLFNSIVNLEIFFFITLFDISLMPYTSPFLTFPTQCEGL